MKRTSLLSLSLAIALAGCHHGGKSDCDPYGGGRRGNNAAPGYDRPFLDVATGVARYMAWLDAHG